MGEILLNIFGEIILKGTWYFFKFCYNWGKEKIKQIRAKVYMDKIEEIGKKEE